MTTPEQRSDALRDLQNLKMARSAHAYVRGSTLQFYEWLDASHTHIPVGPGVWICGDCHIGNLGPIADGRGRVAVQIRDLDQTVIGNPSHDLIRLALSLASAARGSDLPGVTTAYILESLMTGYETAMDGEFGVEEEKLSRPKSIRSLLDRSVRRRWRHLAEERLDGVEPTVPLGKKLWALTGDERAQLAGLFKKDDVRTILSDDGGNSEISFVDAAYWVKGCSSLGRLRFVALLRARNGTSSALKLVDLKEAVAAAAPRMPNARMPTDGAERVVSGARALSPSLGRRMTAATLLGKPIVLRELMPQDLKLEVASLTMEKATALASYLAGVVGKAHGRQMTSEERLAWKRELAKARTGALDAPSWLWRSVVDLLGIHERSYLDHCRTHALAMSVGGKR